MRRTRPVCGTCHPGSIAVPSAARALHRHHREVQATRHRTRGVERMEQIDHRLLELDTLACDGVGHLVADRVHDDARVVVIARYEAAQVVVAPIEEAMPEELVAPIEEVMPEEPVAPIEEMMAEEPATEPAAEEEMPDLAEDDLLNIDALFGNDEEAEAPENVAETTEAAEESVEPEAEEAIGFDDTLGFADEEPEISIPEEPAFTEEMVNTIDEPVTEMNSDPNHMMTPEEIAALIANASAATEEAPVVTEDAISEESEPVAEAEPVPEPVVEEPVAEEPAAEEPKEAEPVIETNSDPNHMMTPEEIAALFANL